MARIQIEERAWSDPRLINLMVRLKIDQAYAMGLLAVLWHCSQEQEKVSVTQEELEIWFHIQIEKGMDVVNALVDSAYLRKRKKHRFTVTGNGTAVSRVSTYKTRAKRANEVRWGTNEGCGQPIKDETKPEPKREKKVDPTRILEEQQMSILKESSNTMTENRMTEDKLTKEKKKIPLLRNGDAAEPVQTHDPLESPHLSGEKIPDQVYDPLPVGDNLAQEYDPFLDETPPVKVQGRKKKTACPVSGGNGPRIDSKGVTSSETPKSISKPSESKSGAHEVIAAYCRAYKARFGYNPLAVKMGKEQAAAKTLATSLGVPEAIRYVEAFVQMADQWFTKTGFKLSILVDNVNSVGLYLDGGIQMTSTVAKTCEIEANNKAVAERTIAYYRSLEAKAANETTADEW